MTFKDLYVANMAWDARTKINVVSFYDNTDRELIMVDDALLKYGNNEVFCFEGNKVIIK